MGARQTRWVPDHRVEQEAVHNHTLRGGAELVAALCGACEGMCLRQIFELVIEVWMQCRGDECDDDNRSCVVIPLQCWV